jgi:hypothetical protein
MISSGIGTPSGELEERLFLGDAQRRRTVLEDRCRPWRR